MGTCPPLQPAPWLPLGQGLALGTAMPSAARRPDAIPHVHRSRSINTSPLAQENGARHGAVRSLGRRAADPVRRPPRLDRRKAAAVRRAGAVPPDGLHVARHAIALVPVKPILWVLLVQLEHEPVPCHLRSPGGGPASGRAVRRAQAVVRMQLPPSSACPSPRLALAMMEAAAITVLFASPLTTGRARSGAMPCRGGGGDREDSSALKNECTACG